MATGIFTRTEKHNDISRKNIKKAHTLPRTAAQREAWRRIGLSRKGKSNPHKGIVFANDIIKHHNDLCRGKLRPDDITLMTHSEHGSLHAKIRIFLLTFFVATTLRR